MIIDKVKEIIANQLSVEVSKLSETTNIGEDLGADSLDLVEILIKFFSRVSFYAHFIFLWKKVNIFLKN